MATLSKMKVEDLKKMAIDRGFSTDEVNDLLKIELIQLLDDSEDAEDGTEEKGINSAGAQSDALTDKDLEDFDGTEIHVHDAHTKEYVRTYRVEDHGEEFLELAKQFKAKKASRFFTK